MAVSAFYFFSGEKSLFATSEGEELKQAVSFAKNYYESQLDLSRPSFSGGGSPYDWHNYAMVVDLVDLRVKEKQAAPDFYLSIDKEVEAAFDRQCGGKGPEECTPRLALLPYCMSKWQITENTPGSALELEAELSKNRAFADSLEFWGSHFENSGLAENELEDFAYYLLAKKLCGSIGGDEAEKLIEKVLQVKIESAAAKEKISSMKNKASAFKILLGRDFISPGGETASKWDSDINANLCSLPSVKETAATFDLCALHDYFKVKSFCQAGPLFGSKAELKITATLLRKQPSLKEATCQIGLYLGAKSFLENNAS
ncbi:MAG: hypothetical protein V1493_01665 [Candidatus Diapherotrites archaeon]